MSIAITPRIGINTRRDEDRLKAENNLLLTIGKVSGVSLPPSPERHSLVAGGMIESYTAGTGTGRKLYRLSILGAQRVDVLIKRGLQ